MAKVDLCFAGFDGFALLARTLFVVQRKLALSA